MPNRDEYRDEIETRIREADFRLPDMGWEMASHENINPSWLAAKAESYLPRASDPEFDPESVAMTVHLMLSFAETWRDIDMLPEVRKNA